MPFKTSYAVNTSLVFVLIVALTAFFLHEDVVFPAKDNYVTSSTCEGCHDTHYTSWHQNTLHPKMFRPVTTPDDIQGDFSTNNPVVTFKKEEIEYVIGNKWEQVYARMIDGEYYPLTAKWMITTQQWVPYKVDSWKDTPLSTQCNGCHTTGFDPETFTFSEFGIGCEACHGPGQQHVNNRRKTENDLCNTCHIKEAHAKGDIVVSTKSAVCGQCHSRGKQPSDHMQTTFNFPLNYQPGQEIDAKFQPLTPTEDTQSKYWWGLGLAKNRHQEFADFSESKHSKSLELLKSKHSEARGKLTDECLECHSQDYRSAPADQKPTLETAQQGLTCVTCHDSHGMGRRFPSVAVTEKRCGQCHADSISFSAAEKDRPHYPGPPSSKSCADCHMPYIVKSGGAYPIRSHAFKIVPPKASLTYDMPNSCQNGGCHSDKSVEWAIEAFEKHYPEYDQGIR
ncbi:multiheme c-type cytochrome [Pontibacterium sp.]|uniref:multiheme c-type cytochrome n=1 Tax=Pontibacterium sp. TaxID=2036026 RepID=UPI00356400DF